MYLKFYGLRRKPFELTPNPEFLFPSPSHKEALASILYGIRERKGFVAVVGEVGTGKTTIIRKVLTQLNPQTETSVYIFYAVLSFNELLQTTLQELGAAPASTETHAMVRQLQAFLVEEYRCNRNVVLIIDEAQNMPIETLEDLRMLSNLETTEEKLLQIILVGQPELEQKLARHEVRQLRQRIAIRAGTVPLSVAESREYVLHRLALVSESNKEVFSKGALKKIVRTAQGRPRLLNILCDNALIAGYAAQQEIVSTRTVKPVISSFRGRPTHVKGFRARPLYRLALVAHLIVLGAVFGYYQGRQGSGPTPVMKTAVKSSEATTNALSAPSEPQEVALVQAQFVGSERLGRLRVASASSATQAISTMPQAPVADVRDPEEIETSVIAEDQPVMENAASGDDGALPLSHIVRKGESLYALAVDVYGHYDDRIVAMILKSNPHIENIDKIQIGRRILFPKPTTPVAVSATHEVSIFP